MIDPHAYGAFVGTVLLMQVTPGPDMTLVVSRGIGEGRTVALWTVLGMTLGAGLVQLPLLALGIAAVLQQSPVAFDALRWMGAAYLLWLGFRLLLARDLFQATQPDAGSCRSTALKAAWQGMINNLTNPKSMLFMLAFLPQFVDPSRGSVAGQLLILGATQKFTGFLVQGAVALASGGLGGWLARRSGWVAWQRRFSGIVLLALGLHLLFFGGARRASAGAAFAR